MGPEERKKRRRASSKRPSRADKKRSRRSSRARSKSKDRKSSRAADFDKFKDAKDRRRSRSNLDTVEEKPRRRRASSKGKPRRRRASSKARKPVPVEETTESSQNGSADSGKENFDKFSVPDGADTSPPAGGLGSITNSVNWGGAREHDPNINWGSPDPEAPEEYIAAVVGEAGGEFPQQQHHHDGEYSEEMHGPNGEEQKKGCSTGMIVAIVITSILAVVAICFTVWWFYIRDSQSSGNGDSNLGGGEYDQQGQGDYADGHDPNDQTGGGLNDVAAGSGSGYVKYAAIGTTALAVVGGIGYYFYDPKSMMGYLNAVGSWFSGWFNSFLNLIGLGDKHETAATCLKKGINYYPSAEVLRTKTANKPINNLIKEIQASHCKGANATACRTHVDTCLKPLKS